MANKVNILPNERIDIPDYEGSTQEFTDSDNKSRFQALFQDRFSHISEGFRVEVADQALLPGQVTVHNGLAFDRSGKLVTSESAADTSRSVTLTGNATYYLEIEFTEEESVVDARAFWDPNHDNGADTSGDILPDGREFNVNVATRKVPEWSIVSPVSTTGFAYSTAPNSNKIPLAIIEVAGGQVQYGTGPNPHLSMRTILREDIGAGASSFKVLNSRSMPQAFTVIVDAESLSITANDQENGILTIGGVTAVPHAAGDRVVVAGAAPALYIPQRTTPALPTAGTWDARPRLFGGDEETGHALMQDPDAASGNADTQIENLKNYIDFLAGQIRQLKFGSARGAEVGTVSPPIAFTAAPRYFENAGSVLGARSNTVSVGDGVNSFGDFNTAQSGTAQAAIQGAIDAIPASGGTVYIKQGTYAITATTCEIGIKNIRFIGDGAQSTIIQSTGAVAAFTVSSLNASVSYEHLSFENNGTADYALDHSQPVTSTTFQSCRVEGFRSNSGFFAAYISAYDTAFVGTTTGTLNHAARIDKGASFIDCQFSTEAGVVATARAFYTSGGISSKFTNCSFTTDTGPTHQVTLDSAGAFSSCSFGTATAIELGGSTAAKLSIIDCTFAGPVGTLAGAATDESQITISDCQIAVPQNGYGVLISAPGASIRHNIFTQASSTGGTTGVGILLDTSANAAWSGGSVSNNQFYDCDVGIHVDSTLGPDDVVALSVVDNKIICDGTAGRGRVGIYLTGLGSLLDSHFERNTIIGLDSDDGAGTINAAIYANAGASSLTVFRCSFNANTMRDIGSVSASNTTSAYGIRIDGPIDCGNTQIKDNNIYGVKADIDNGGIFVEEGTPGTDVLSVCGNTMNYVGTALGDTAASQYTYGIFVGTWDNLTVSDNILSNIGSPGATSAHTAAIKLGTSGVFTTNVGGTVSGNVINGVRHGGSNCYGIWLDTNATDLTITGNQIYDFSGAANTYGIYGAQENPAALDIIQDITVTGNTIRGGLNTGIEFYFVGSNGGDDYSGFVISNNRIRDYDYWAIGVIGDSGNSSPNVAITGNSCKTWEEGTSLVGIHVADCVFVAISGNNLEHVVTANANRGIRIWACTDYAIGSNQLYTVGGTGAGIDCTSSTRGTLSGNQLYGNQAFGIVMGDYAYANGNRMSGFTSAFFYGATQSFTTLIDNTGAPGAPSDLRVTAGVVDADVNVET